MWISGRWRWLVNLLIILMIVMFVTNTFRDWGFPWWIFFFVWPVFGSWNRESRRESTEKRKRDYDTFEPAYEKPKREPRYALGDDGELIELPADEVEEDAKPKRRDYV